MHPVRFEAVRAPDTLHRADADPDRLGHGRRRPVGRLARRRSSGEIDDLTDNFACQRRFARRAGLVAQQPIHPRLHKAFLPTPDHRFALAGLPHHRGGAETIRREQNDAGAPHMFLRAVPIGNDSRQALAITSRDIHYDSFAHSPNSHDCKSQGILKGTQSLASIH